MAAQASPPSTASSSPIESYIGSFISLISKYEIRYEGVLYHLDIQDSTIGLRNVRSYGTEGRKKDGPEVPPSDKVFEYILFRGSDIKDLQVKSSPTAQTDEQIEKDPAIVKSQYAGPSLSSSRSSAADGKILVESAQGQNTPIVVTTGFVQPSTTLSHVGSVTPSQETLIAGSSCSAPIYQQGHGGTLISEALAPQHSMHVQSSPIATSLSGMQNHILGSGLRESPIWGLTNLTEVPSAVPSSLVPKNSIVLSSMSDPSAPDMSSYTSAKTLPPLNTQFADGIHSSIPSVQLATQATSKAESQRVDGATSEPTVFHFHPSTSSVALSYRSSIPSSLPVHLPPLLGPQQLMQSSMHTHSFIANQDMGALQSSSSSTSTPLISASVSQAPLLPLPNSVQQNRQWTTQFSQEFDFEAMNQQFNKDEVWGHLGKAKQKEKLEAAEYGSSNQNSRDIETPRLMSDIDSKPAYNKDDFFDSISRTSHNRGRNIQNPGRFYPRPNFGHFDYHGAGHNNFYDSHSSGRGYGYGGRGRRI